MNSNCLFICLFSLNYDKDLFKPVYFELVEFVFAVSSASLKDAKDRLH